MMGETTVTLAVADPLPFVAVAVTVHVVVGYKGAVRRPVEEIEPHFVVHCDGVLAVNCCVVCSFNVTAVGEMVTPKAGILSSDRKLTIPMRTEVKATVE